MVDINLFLELIQSIPNGSNIILVGDADQLPPIGPGQPFKDMIESKKVNISKLSGNFRQNNLSNIIKASRSIITGKLPSMETEFKNSDFIFISAFVRFRVRRLNGSAPSIILSTASRFSANIKC